VPAHPDTIPLGKGIQDTQLLILNAAMNLAGIGEVGEIYLRSPHLALGYLDDEDLTRQRFISNPATRDPADRLYKTGDLGRYLPDGNAVFCGRVDRQVKIRGFRIETGEIETLLRQHPGVKDADVVALEDPAGERRLAAYTVSTCLPNPGLDDLRGFLQDKLPEYMLPSVQVSLDALPLTPNGKLDLGALPAPSWLTQATPEGLPVAADELERMLVEMWQRVLHREPIGVQDNFFALGGHSLIALRIFAEIEESLGKRLPLRSLYSAATVAQQAALLCDEHSDLRPACLVPLQANGSKKPLYCIHDVTGLIGCYQGLLHYFGEDQPVYGVQSVGLEKNPGLSVTIESLASRYRLEIQAFQPVGPYQICSYSFGGILAYDIAQQLLRAAEKVTFM